MISHIITNSGMSFVYGNKPYAVQKTHPNYKRIVDAVYSEDEDVLYDIEALLNVGKVVESQLSTMNTDRVEVRDGAVYVDGEVMHSTLTRRMLKMLEEGLSIEPMIKFLKNLLDNPSRTAVQEGYDFLEHDNLPLTEDGCFLAYKAVRRNYLDKHTGTVDNSVGKVISMERRNVDDDRRKECSNGYHVGGLEYSGPGGSFYCSGDRVMIVKVNPADIVSVPLDYDANKMRVCRYEVVGEYEVPLSAPLYSTDGDVHEVESDDFDYGTEEVDVFDIEEGDRLTFDYEGKPRYCLVEELLDDGIGAMLLRPEENAGKYRHFLFDKMTNVQYN